MAEVHNAAGADVAPAGNDAISAQMMMHALLPPLGGELKNMMAAINSVDDIFEGGFAAKPVRRNVEATFTRIDLTTRFEDMVSMMINHAPEEIQDVVDPYHLFSALGDVLGRDGMTQLYAAESPIEVMQALDVDRADVGPQQAHLTLYRRAASAWSQRSLLRTVDIMAPFRAGCHVQLSDRTTEPSYKFDSKLFLLAGLAYAAQQGRKDVLATKGRLSLASSLTTRTAIIADNGTHSVRTQDFGMLPGYASASGVALAYLQLSTDTHKFLRAEDWLSAEWPPPATVAKNLDRAAYARLEQAAQRYDLFESYWMQWTLLHFKVDEPWYHLCIPMMKDLGYSNRAKITARALVAVRDYADTFMCPLARHLSELSALGVCTGGAAPLAPFTWDPAPWAAIKVNAEPVYLIRALAEQLMLHCGDWDKSYGAHSPLPDSLGMGAMGGAVPGSKKEADTDSTVRASAGMNELSLYTLGRWCTSRMAVTRARGGDALAGKWWPTSARIKHVPYCVVGFPVVHNGQSCTGDYVAMGHGLQEAVPWRELPPPRTNIEERSMAQLAVVRELPVFTLAVVPRRCTHAADADLLHIVPERAWLGEPRTVAADFITTILESVADAPDARAVREAERNSRGAWLPSETQYQLRSGCPLTQDGRPGYRTWPATRQRTIPFLPNAAGHMVLEGIDGQTALQPTTGRVFTVITPWIVDPDSDVAPVIVAGALNYTDTVRTQLIDCGVTFSMLLPGTFHVSEEPRFMRRFFVASAWGSSEMYALANGMLAPRRLVALEMERYVLMDSTADALKSMRAYMDDLMQRSSLRTYQPTDVVGQVDNDAYSSKLAD